jgi:signal transduction histidine kinase
LESTLFGGTQTEEAFLKEQHYLRCSMDYLPDAIYFKDTSRRFVQVNQAQGQRLGLADYRQAVGKTECDFFGPGYAAQAFEDEQGIIHSGKLLIQVVISISETGCGVPENIRHKILEPFFTTEEAGRGTGHGLAIARAIVEERHGGSLNFDSERGRGTAFTIPLPVEFEADPNEGPV